MSAINWATSSKEHEPETRECLFMVSFMMFDEEDTWEETLGMKLQLGNFREVTRVMCMNNVLIN